MQMDWSLITRMNKTNTTQNRKKRKKQDTADVVRRGLKHCSGFLFGLFVNVIIVYAVVKLFSYSFNFAYDVFGDVAKDPYSTEYVMVEVPKDSSVINIGEALEEAGIIKDKYVFFVKVKIKKYENKITPGKYALSPAMKFEQIAEVICDLDEEEEKK